MDDLESTTSIPDSRRSGSVSFGGDDDSFQTNASTVKWSNKTETNPLTEREIECGEMLDAAISAAGFDSSQQTIVLGALLGAATATAVEEAAFEKLLYNEGMEVTAQSRALISQLRAFSGMEDVDLTRLILNRLRSGSRVLRIPSTTARGGEESVSTLSPDNGIVNGASQGETRYQQEDATSNRSNELSGGTLMREGIVADARSNISNEVSRGSLIGDGRTAAGSSQRQVRYQQLETNISQPSNEASGESLIGHDPIVAGIAQGQARNPQGESTSQPSNAASVGSHSTLMGQSINSMHGVEPPAAAGIRRNEAAAPRPAGNGIGDESEQDSLDLSGWTNVQDAANEP